MVAALLAPALAGCGSPAADGDAAPLEVTFSGTFDVDTTPDEAGEARGTLRVAYAPGLLAIESATEPDLYHATVVTEQEAYVSQAQVGWVRYDLRDAMREDRLSNRLLVWDLPRLLASGDLEVAERNATGADAPAGAQVTALAGRVERAGRAFDVELQVAVLAGQAVWMRLDSPQAREAPFTFRPSSATVPWTAVPDVSYTPAETARLDAQAKDGHAVLAELVELYRDNHAGLLPERVDPETLRLELLRSGEEWPASPYDGTPMRHGGGSGHFDWKRCSISTGRYLGLGLDTPVHPVSFGSCS
jgi:hypothetical protein